MFTYNKIIYTDTVWVRYATLEAGNDSLKDWERERERERERVGFCYK